jgi:hypothetical protein
MLLARLVDRVWLQWACPRSESSLATSGRARFISQDCPRPSRGHANARRRSRCSLTDPLDARHRHVREIRDRCDEHRQ